MQIRLAARTNAVCPHKCKTSWNNFLIVTPLCLRRSELWSAHLRLAISFADIMYNITFGDYSGMRSVSWSLHDFTFAKGAAWRQRASGGKCIVVYMARPSSTCRPNWLLPVNSKSFTLLLFQVAISCKGLQARQVW